MWGYTNTMEQKDKIAILGYGIEGKAVWQYLKNSSEHQKATITILDAKQGKNYLKRLKRFDVIFRSPGIPYLLPEIQNARKSGAKITSATKLFFEKCPCPIIGITGTKGKSTTATLIYKILKAAGKDVYLAGNIGTPAVKLLPKPESENSVAPQLRRKSRSNRISTSRKLKKNSLVVLELSSFQLQDLKHSPKTAVLLEIMPEHLDYHKTFQEYWNAKAVIAKYQKQKNRVIFPKNNPWTGKIAKQSAGKKIAYSLADKNFLLWEVRRSLRLPGRHNVQNAYAAALAVKAAGLPEKSLKKILGKILINFRGLPFRLQLIRKRPLTYNDSASTNPGATIAGIQAIDPTILIMGGISKNLSYKDLPETIECSPIKKILIFGKNRNELKKALAKFPSIKTFSTLPLLARHLNKNAAKNDIILFSPGAASFDPHTKWLPNRKAVKFQNKRHGRINPRAQSKSNSEKRIRSHSGVGVDQFQNYQERGKVFNKLIL